MKSLADGAIEPWTKPKYRPLFTDLKRYARQAGIPLDMAWIDLAEEQRNAVLNGEGIYGCARILSHLESKKYKLHVRVFLSRIADIRSVRIAMARACGLKHGRYGYDKNLCEVCS